MFDDNGENTNIEIQTTYKIKTTCSSYYRRAIAVYYHQNEDNAINIL